MPTFPLTTSVKSLNRLRRIVRVLVQHGFGHIVEQINLGRYMPFRKRVREDAAKPAVPAESPGTSLGRRLASVCVDLGPTFVKLGQVLSVRSDLASPDVLAELRGLQDKVPSFDSDVARSIIADEIGTGIDECFASLDDEPFASGSIGQVYGARSHDGQDLVVKVKRPGIEDVIRLDLQLLKWMAEAIERFVPELARYGPQQIVDEFEQLLMRELDYMTEASATARFEEAFADDADVSIPSVQWDLTGPRVLTMTRLHGLSVEELLNEETPNNVDRRLLARNLVDLYLKQFFDLRHFHADPHPGNFLIQPPARIGLLDFGQVGVLSDELAGQLIVLTTAMIYRETQIAVDVLWEVGAVGAETDTGALARSLRLLLDKYHGRALKHIDLVTVFNEVTGVFRSHHITLPAEMVLVLKTLVTAAGVALKLDPQMNLVAVVRPKLKKLVADRFSPNRLVRGAGISLWHLFSMIKSAPQQLRSALRLMSRGKWQIHIRHENLEQLANEMDRSSNRLSFAIVIAAVIMGSSVVISAPKQVAIAGLPIQWLGIAGYLFAGVLGIGLLWAILRSGRLY